MKDILGVCGGNGVILHPFLNDPHFRVIGNIEPRAIFATPDNAQWKMNFKSIPLIKEDMGYADDRFRGVKPFLIIGAPDCGDNSVLRMSRAKKAGNSKTNKSMTTFIESVQFLQPSVFIMENLPALLKVFSREDLLNLFPSYDIRLNVGSVSEYGNSQITRKRLLIIGVLKGGKISKAKFVPHRVNVLRRVKSISPDLWETEDMNICNVRENIKDMITIYAGKKLSLKAIRDKWKEMPLGRWIVTDRRFTTAPGVYMNTPHRYPVTARKANRQFNPKGLTMSPRELADVQGIPRDFILTYDDKRKQFWINKARATATKCPPYEIGQWAYEILKNV